VLGKFLRQNFRAMGTIGLIGLKCSPYNSPRHQSKYALND